MQQHKRASAAVTSGPESEVDPARQACCLKGRIFRHANAPPSGLHALAAIANRASAARQPVSGPYCFALVWLLSAAALATLASSLALTWAALASLTQTSLALAALALAAPPAP